MSRAQREKKEKGQQLMLNEYRKGVGDFDLFTYLFYLFITRNEI